MAPTGSSQNNSDHGELARYPGIVVHLGLLPESWFPKWLDRKLRARQERKQADAA